MNEGSRMFRLNFNDFVKGAASAVFAAVCISLYRIASVEGFDIFSADWGEIGRSAVNWAVAAFLGYLGKNFMSTPDGKILGRIG